MSGTQELLTLDQLASLGGDDGVDLGGKRGPFKDPFEVGLAYPVRITEQKLSTTKNGWTQVQLKLQPIKSDGELGNGSNRWLSLPVFSPEKMSSEDPEKLNQLKGIFGEKLHGLLKAVDPETFTICRMEKIGGKWRFFDALTGDEMEKAAKTAREKQIGKAVIGVASLLRDEKFDLTGRNLYYVRTQDKDKADKFYDNFYSVQPDKYAPAGV